MPKPKKATSKPPTSKPRASRLEKIQAEFAFVREGRTLPEIAEAHDRAYSTVLRWFKDGLWDQARKRFLLSDSGQADIIMNAVQKVLLQLQDGTRDLTAPTANMILQAKRAEREIRGDKYSFTQLFAIIKQFLGHVRAADPTLLPVLEKHIEAFLEAQKEDLLAKRG